MNTAPLFIIGTERSGSNLLRLILNAHSAIAVPHPPHILKFFSPFEKYYGDLTRPDKLRGLVDDVLGLIRVHVYKWEMYLDPEVITATANPPDLLGVFFSIYNAYLQESGKRRWGCKSTFIIHHITRIQRFCPEAKFIFLVRDPRDVAISARRSIFSSFHPYFTANLWRRQQLEGLRFYDKKDGTCHLIRYEDLITQPKATIGNLCEFLGEEYEPTMLEFHRTKAALKSEELSESWHNTASPIQANNQKRYLTDLSDAEISLIEGVTGDLMARFGYPLNTSPGHGRQVYPLINPGILRRYLYKFGGIYWAVKIEIRAACHDKNYRQFWRRRIFLTRLCLRFQYILSAFTTTD